MSENLNTYLEQYGYWMVLGAIMLEDFGLPVPGETVLIAAAIFASQGRMHIILLLLAGWFGAVTGDNIGYAIGRFGGRAFIVKYGRYVFITPKRLERVESFFQKYGGAVVIVARFFEILRQLNGIAAGVAKMRWWRFLLYNAIGAALWVGFWGVSFYFLGEQASRFEKVPVYIGIIFAGGVIAIGIGLFVYRLRRRRKR